MESPIGNARGDNGSDKPGGVEKGSHDRSFVGIGQLADEGGGIDNGKGDAETENPAGSEKHVGVARASLQSGAGAHDQRGGEDGAAPPEVLAYCGDEGDGHERAEGVHCVEEAEAAGRGVFKIWWC